jgi:hypothetical protein
MDPRAKFVRALYDQPLVDALSFLSELNASVEADRENNEKVFTRGYHLTKTLHKYCYHFAGFDLGDADEKNPSTLKLKEVVDHVSTESAMEAPYTSSNAAVRLERVQKAVRVINYMCLAYRWGEKVESSYPDIEKARSKIMSLDPDRADSRWEEARAALRGCDLELKCRYNIRIGTDGEQEPCNSKIKTEIERIVESIKPQFEAMKQISGGEKLTPAKVGRLEHALNLWNFQIIEHLAGVTKKYDGLCESAHNAIQDDQGVRSDTLSLIKPEYFEKYDMLRGYMISAYGHEDRRGRGGLTDDNGVRVSCLYLLLSMLLT